MPLRVRYARTEERLVEVLHCQCAKCAVCSYSHVFSKMCCDYTYSVRFVDVYVRFRVNITPADSLVAGVFTTMYALSFDHLVFGVSHTATSTSVHYSFPLLFPWGLGLFLFRNPTHIPNQGTLPREGAFVFFNFSIFPSPPFFSSPRKVHQRK